MNSHITFAMLFLPDLSANILLLPAAILVAFAVSIKLIQSGVIGNLSKSPLFRISLVVLAQIAVLAVFQAKYQAVVEHGQAVILKAKPFDPLDFFRGNYQLLTYDMSVLDRRKVPFDFTPAKGDIVFVSLKQREDTWQAAGVFHQKPDKNEGPFLKGQVTYATADSVTVHYGIEQFFYPDTKQIDMSGGAMVTAIIDENGDAVLTNLVPIPNKEHPRTNRVFVRHSLRS